MIFYDNNELALTDPSMRRLATTTEINCGFEQTADNDTASTYQVSSVQLVTNKKLGALNKA